MRDNANKNKEWDMLPNQSDFLVHHGVPGQKKGVRRYQNTDGSLTQEGRIHYGVGEKREKTIGTKLKESVGSAAKATGKVVKTGAVKVKAAAGNAVRKGYSRIKKKYVKEDLSAMSDQELRDKTNRLRAEAEYNRLKREASGLPSGNSNNNNGGGGKGGNFKARHFYLDKAALTPIAGAIGIGIGLVAKEKVSKFIDHRANNKLSTFMNAARNSTSEGHLNKLLEAARRAAESSGHPMQSMPNVSEIVRNNAQRIRDEAQRQEIARLVRITAPDRARVNDFIRRASVTNRTIIRRPRHFASA